MLSNPSIVHCLSMIMLNKPQIIWLDCTFNRIFLNNISWRHTFMPFNKWYEHPIFLFRYLYIIESVGNNKIYRFVLVLTIHHTSLGGKNNVIYSYQWVFGLVLRDGMKQFYITPFPFLDYAVNELLALKTRLKLQADKGSKSSPIHVALFPHNIFKATNTEDRVRKLF